MQIVVSRTDKQIEEYHKNKKQNSYFACSKCGKAAWTSMDKIKEHWENCKGK